MVNADGQQRLEHKIYKSREAVEEYATRCFGPALNWQCAGMGNMDNIEFM